MYVTQLIVFRILFFVIIGVIVALSVREIIVKRKLKNVIASIIAVALAVCICVLSYSDIYLFKYKVEHTSVETGFEEIVLNLDYTVQKSENTVHLEDKYYTYNLSYTIDSDYSKEDFCFSHLEGDFFDVAKEYKQGDVTYWVSPVKYTQYVYENPDFVSSMFSSLIYPWFTVLCEKGDKAVIITVTFKEYNVYSTPNVDLESIALML